MLNNRQDSEVEKQIIAIWKSVLNVKKIAVDENFLMPVETHY